MLPNVPGTVAFHCSSESDSQKSSSRLFAQALYSNMADSGAFTPQARRMVRPPSTGRVTPVTNEAAGRQRLSVICATSSGSP